MAKKKNQGRKLNKILEVKQKKAKRKEILEKLAGVQVSKDELSLLLSTSGMQTKGLKRFHEEQKFVPTEPSDTIKVNSISGKRKKRRKVEEVVEIKPGENNTSDEETSSSDESIDAEEMNVHDHSVPNDSAPKESSVDEVTLIKHEHEKTKTITETTSNGARIPTDKDIEKEKIDKMPAVYITLNRLKAIQDARLKLPILAEEQLIMEAIREHPVVVLCGETGSGKTTQVPQFLYEAGYTKSKMIAVTEPRRVAAISMSRRVAEEMNLSSTDVSYQIRFEGNVSENTKIKFMTDGVLLKEIEKDFLLTKHSVIIIDEAHERSVYTDVLIGLLSRIVPLREKRGIPLKLIIMSATLRVEDFTENKRLFKIKPPVIKVDARQFPVSIHFNKRTPVNNYLDEAYRKVCKIHRKLPEGGILVFVTGRQEVNILCHKLRKTFPMRKNTGEEKSNQSKEGENENNDSEEELPLWRRRRPVKGMKAKAKNELELPKVNLDDFPEIPEATGYRMDVEEMSDLDEMLNDDDSDDDEILSTMLVSDDQPLYVLPLFSLLSSDRQSKVFKPPPSGSRLCVVSTNVAETSLTIPNVKYVVDTGKVKTRLYDKVTGVSAFVVTWTSKAAANQRAGRAGRTGPGHCYRLYSSAVFNDEFQLFTVPEICRKPIDDLVLQMKDMNIDRVVNFPFPSAPDSEALKAAEKRLCLLGALDEPPKNLRFQQLKAKEWSNKVTSLGHVMACFPVSPCYAKMLALSLQQDLLAYVVCIVSALTVQELLLDAPISAEAMEQNSVSFEQKKRWKERRLKWAGQGQSLLLGDVMVLLKAVGAAEYSRSTPVFCSTHGLRYKAIIEVRKLRTQLTNVINLVIPSADLCVDPKMTPPDELKIKLLRQIVLAGIPYHVARKIPECEIKEGEDKRKYKRAYESIEVDDLVFIEPNSILHAKQPAFIVYQEVMETTKLYLRGITAIEPEWLPIYASSSCNFSKPLEEPKPRYNAVKDEVVCHMTSTFGPRSWPLPAVELKYPDGTDRYRWFAKFLLEGQIVAKLEKFKPLLLSLPITMTKSWARLQPRTEKLLSNLVDENVHSKSALLSAWTKNRSFLLEAYCDWLPESTHKDVHNMWPPV